MAEDGEEEKRHSLWVLWYCRITGFRVETTEVVSLMLKIPVRLLTFKGQNSLCSSQDEGKTKQSATQHKTLLCICFSREYPEVLKTAEPTFTSAFPPYDPAWSLAWQVSKLGSSISVGPDAGLTMYHAQQSLNADSRLRGHPSKVTGCHDQSTVQLLQMSRS